MGIKKNEIWEFDRSLLDKMNGDHFNNELIIKVPSDPLYSDVVIGIINKETSDYCHAVSFTEQVDQELIQELTTRLKEWYPRAKKALEIE